MNPGSDVAERAAKILLVDDNADNRALMQIILESDGFLISTAASGAEALASVAREHPDLVLLDWIMPDMDGYEVASGIKGCAATKHIPIIVLSGMDDGKTRVRAQSAGADDFLAKPLDLAALRRRVRELLPTHALPPLAGSEALS